MNSKTYKKILIALLGLTLLTKVQPVYAWDDCPKGKENDPYPGDCARYVDTDNNGICDHSEPAPEDRVKETAAGTTTADTEEKTEKEDVSQNQLALSNSASSVSTHQDDTFWSKSMIAGGIVLTHLVGILIYTNRRKAALRRQ